MSISHEQIKKEQQEQTLTQQQSPVQQQQEQTQPLLQMPQQQVNRQVQLPGAVTMHVEQKDVLRQEASSGRSIAKLLLGQNAGKDSDAMKNAKDSVKELESLLEQPLAQTDMASYIESLEAAYLKAISYCRYYCDHRNPSFETGIQRKKAVSDELESLLRERARLNVAKQLLKDGSFDVAEKNGQDLLEAAWETVSQQEQQNQPEQPVQADPMQALKFTDFARMLGTYNRGQIEFDGKGLKIINNGRFSMSKGVASTRNYELAQYFKSLVIQELERAQVPVTERIQIILARQLGLAEGQSAIRPISREAVYEIVRMVNDYTSVVDQTLRKGREALPEDHRLAVAIHEMLSSDAQDEHQKRTQQEHEEVLRSQVTDILKEAKAQGMRVPELTRHQMDNLVKGNINLVRTRAFQYMHSIYERMCNLNGGRVVDFNRLAGDKKLLSRIMAFTIAKISAVSAAGVDVAEHELSVQITEAAFKYSGKENLKEAFDKSDVRMFSTQGDEGLEACVERTYPKVKAWNGAQVRVKKGMDGLTDLSRSLKSLHDMKEKAFSDGLTVEEAATLRALGTHIQNLITGQEQGAPTMEDMEFVSEQLTGTRYQEGFTYVKQLKEGFSFAEAADQIADATTYREEDAEEKKLREAYGKLNPGADDVPRPMAEPEKLLGSLGGQARSVAEVLLMTKKPSELVKEKEDGISRDLVKLRYALNNFISGVAHIENLTVGEVDVRLTQSERGAFEIWLGRQKIRIPYSPDLIAAKMDTDISLNADTYGERVAGEVLSDAVSSADQNLGEQKTALNRTLFLNALCQKTGLPAARFNNVSPVKLAGMTRDLLSGAITVTDVTAELQRLSEASMNQLNEQDTLDMLRIMEEREQLKQEKRVIFRPQEQEEKKEDAKEAKWTKEEEELKNFVADMIFSKETWKTDTDRSTPAERMKALILPHASLLAKIIYEPEILNNMLDKLYMPGAEDLTATLREQINEVFQSGMFKELKERCGTNIFVGKLTLTACLSMAMSNQQPSEALLKKVGLEEEWPQISQTITEQLTNLDQIIAEQVKTQIGTIQDSITEAVGTVFSAKEEETEQEITDDNVGPEIEKLSQILENAAKGQQGQGKFMRIVLSNYFKDADLIDQRAMLAGALRDLKPANVKPGEVMDEKTKETYLGHFLGGFLKGAGPLMHKMLQGLPTESMPEALKNAVGDMKSNLAPIPQKIVEARLDKIVDRSHGSITKIEVVRSMGAASVGQVFLCKMFGPGMAEDGKDVVVKLLRPDVSNHMAREKRHMLKYAQDTDEQGGMLATYQGQLARIEEELDLRIEAENVKRGEVYDQGAKTVQSVKLNDLVEPDVNTLVMEKAQGTTVDKYLTETEKERTRLKEALDTAEDGGYEILEKLDQMLDGLMKRQKYLIQAAQKWIASGLYNEGFYHGDLHAGNIMVSEEGATIVDFGNATQLTEDQRKHIMHMLCTASIGDAKKFRHHFHMLMSKGSEEAYQKNKKAFGEILEDVLNREDMSHAGERIAVALLKAQELGMELPGAVFNFSQCQLRLQNTIADMNQMINRVVNNISDLILRHEPKARKLSPVGVWKTKINAYLDDLRQKRPVKESIGQAVQSELDDKYNQKLSRETILENLLDDGLTDIDDGLLLNLKLLNGQRELFKTTEVGQRHIGTAVSVCRAAMDVLLMGCPEEEKDVRDALEDLQKRLIAAFKNKDINKIDETVDEVLTCKKGSVTEAYLADREQYKKIKMQPVSEEELKKAEDHLLDNARRMHEWMNQSQKKMPAVWSGLIARMHAEDQTAFQQEMKSWFEDKEKFGDELKKAYDAYLTARASGTTEECDQAEDAFLDVLKQAIPKRVEYFYQMYEKQRKLDDPEDFFDTMSTVISERQTETVSKLGFFNAYSYRQIREGKSLVQVSPVAAARKKREEARDVVFDIGQCLDKLEKTVKMIRPDHETDQQAAQIEAPIWNSIREELTEKDMPLTVDIHQLSVDRPEYVSKSSTAKWNSQLKKAGQDENIALVQQVIDEMKQVIADVKRRTGYKTAEDLIAERDQARSKQAQNHQ